MNWDGLPWHKDHARSLYEEFQFIPATLPPAPTKPPLAAGGVVSQYPTPSLASTYETVLRQMQQMNFTFSMNGTSISPANDVKFSGKAFSASTAKGARSFRIDSLGRLTGIHYKQVWTPGENVAECKAETPHEDGKFPECRCGFYGYYDGSNDYYQAGYVSAVVEGYGEAVLGDKGFRVTKARILALSIDRKVEGANLLLVRRNYADIPMFDSFNAMLTEYPTDFGLDDSKPTPDEPDFWTRNA